MILLLALVEHGIAHAGAATPSGESSNAQQLQLSVTQAVNKALEASPDRAVIQAQRDSLLAKKRRALSPVSPRLGIGFGDLAGPPTRENANIRTYQLSQSFGFPGKGLIDSKGFGLDAAAADSDLAAKDLEVTRIVKSAYYDLWLSRRKLDLNATRRESFETILAIAKKRFVKETTTEVESLSTQVALENVTNERADFVALERTAESALDILLGEPTDKALSIESPPTPEISINRSRELLRNALLSKSPSLRAFDARIRAASSRVTVAQMAALPDFTLNAGTNNLGGFAGGVQLTIPLWYFFNEQEGIDSAKKDRLVTEAQLEVQKRTLLLAFESRLNVLESQWQKLQTYKTRTIPTAERAYQVALRNYRFGKVDFATLTNATNNFINARIDYESLLMGYLTTVAVIEETVGGQIP